MKTRHQTLRYRTVNLRCVTCHRVARALNPCNGNGEHGLTATNYVMGSGHQANTPKVTMHTPKPKLRNGSGKQGIYCDGISPSWNGATQRPEYLLHTFFTSRSLAVFSASVYATIYATLQQLIAQFSARFGTDKNGVAFLFSFYRIMTEWCKTSADKLIELFGV